MTSMMMRAHVAVGRPCPSRSSARPSFNVGPIGGRTRCLAAPDGSPVPPGDEDEASKRQVEDKTLGSALGRSLTELSKSHGRVAGSTNLLLVGESEEAWRKLDTKVNKYPIQRTFTAIGTGGKEFREAMVHAVEVVVGSVHTECVSERHSSGKNYISVTVGPVWVENGDQIIQVYSNMKADARARWII